MYGNENTMPGEIQELHHEAWPHFRAAFVAVFVLFTIYLAVVFFSGGGHMVGGH